MFCIIFVADAHRTVLHGVELKKTSLQKLKKELENIERETESKLLEIDKNNAELEVSEKCWLTGIFDYKTIRITFYIYHIAYYGMKKIIYIYINSKIISIS